MTEHHEYRTQSHRRLDDDVLYKHIIQTNSNLQRYLDLAPSLTPASLNSNSLSAQRSREYEQLPITLYSRPKSRPASASK